MRLWTSPAAPAVGVAAALGAVAAVVLFVDLTPRVEGDFFFAEDDPQMEASREVERRFPLDDQMILRVADAGLGEGVGLDDPVYLDRVGRLTEDLLAVEGVEGGFGIATDDPSSPLFGRILLTPDPAATNVVLLVGDVAPELLLPRVEAVVAEHEGPELEIVVSGVPAIVEMIRRSLFRDLVVFSLAAVLVFALLMAAIYRDAAVVVGTLATCFVSVGATLLVVRAMDVGIGLLTANLVTIVFVLTLSHVVFLTGNWRRVAGPGAAGNAGGTGSGEAVGSVGVVGVAADAATGWGRRVDLLARAVRDTAEGSFWSMATTLLGFASLLVASARPLRELGMAGVVGASIALLVAYVVYPAFLGAWTRIPAAGAASTGGVDAGGAGAALRGAGTGEDRATSEGRGGRAGGSLGAARWTLPFAGLVVAVMLAGVLRLNTDPGLLTYFQEGSELREGLSRIDEDGGSSTLDLVVADPDGGSIAGPDVFPDLQELQAELEADPAVGVVLSPTVLIEHARTVPLAAFLPVGVLLDMASSEALDGVGLGFVTPDRSEARFSLRMRETWPEPRAAVLDRVRETVGDAGLEPVVVAGLYDLQERLGRLIASSLKVGIGGLLALFLVIAGVASRSLRTTVFMWLCLVAIPVVTLGSFGLLGVALDLITSPAANIALAVGADAMLHLVVRRRRLADEGVEAPWATAVSQIGPPVVSATAIVCAGFGIFALSSFPPTQRFGFAVMVGTVTAAAMALVILPRLATLSLPSSPERA